MDASERIVYDRERLKVLSIQWFKNEHPDWPREKCVEEGAKEENIDMVMRMRLAADLADKISENEWQYATPEYFLHKAKRVVENAPRELYQNINEYIEGKELSDIKLHGWSVSDVMHQFAPHKKIDFIDAIVCISYWRARNYQNDNYCREFFLQ